MTARDFCYWLQGFFEISGTPTPTFSIARAQMLRQHLKLVVAYDHKLATAEYHFCCDKRGEQHTEKEQQTQPALGSNSALLNV
jgi:hypothetical protein